MVTGIIEGTTVTQHSAEVKVRFDEPHQWGNELYECDWAHARLHDEFGSLHHLEIIDDKYRTVKVTFSQSIREINTMFTGDYSNWHTVNLKEWIDNWDWASFQYTGDTASGISADVSDDRTRGRVSAVS
jgi:hypothetical protein